MGQGPLPSPGNVLKCSLNFLESSAIEYSCRWFIGYSGGPATVADLNTINFQCYSQFQNNVISQFPTDIQLVSTTLQDLSSQTGVEVVHGGSALGGDATSSLESGVATVLRFIIARHYRGGHPKVYLPGLSTANLNQPGTWKTSAQTTLASNFQTYVNNVIGGSTSSVSSMHHVAVSWYDGATPNSDPSKWAPKNVPALRGTPQVYNVTGYVTAPLVGSQRRRRTATGG